MRQVVKAYTTLVDWIMDHFSTENTDFDFDDNGLWDIRLPASRQQIVYGDGIGYTCKTWGDLMLSHCDANPIERDEDETTKSYWTPSFVIPEIISPMKIGLNRENVFKKEIRLMDGFVYHLRRLQMMCRRTIFPINYEESKQEFPNLEKDLKKRERLKHDLKFHLCHTRKTEGAWNVVGRSTTRSGKVGARETKFRSEQSFASMSWKFCISFAFVILTVMPSIGVEGALPSIPVNTLFVVGETARMNCSTDLNQPVYWTRTLAGSDIQQWLYYGKNGFNTKNADERFIINKDEPTGRYDIIITDVQLKDAGQYTCVDEAGLGARASAELVVSDAIKCDSHIPSDGVMGDNVFGIKQDFIEISCSLTYTGNLSPTLEWSWPGAGVQSSQLAVNDATSSVTSTLKLSPPKELNNIHVRCKANIEGATQNLINGGRLWESETVNIRYSEFVSKEVDVCPGVKWNLVCNPQCSYNFERIDNECQCLYTYLDTRTQQKYEINSDTISCGCLERNDAGIVIMPIIVIGIVTVVYVVAAVIVIRLARYVKNKNVKPAERLHEATEDREPSGAMTEGYRININDPFLLLVH